MSFSTARRLLVVLLAALIAVVLVAPLLAVTGADAAERRWHSVQRGTTNAPDQAARGSKLRVTGRFTPARRGRPVVLETYDAESRVWRRLARAKQDAAGVARFTTTFRGGPVRYRTRALPVRAARAHAAPAVRVGELTNLTRGDALSTNPSVSRDGQHVVFSSAAHRFGVTGPDEVGVFVMDVGTRRTVRLDPGDSNGALPRPSMSPDGQHVAFFHFPARPTADDQGGLYLWDRRTGKSTLVVPPSGRMEGGELRWVTHVADGGYLVYSVLVRDPYGEERYVSFGRDPRTGARQQIPFRRGFNEPIGITADGKHVFGTVDGSSVVRWERPSGKVTTVLTAPTSTSAPDVSPRGRYLAYLVRDARTSELRLQLKDLVAGTVTRVPYGKGVTGRPSVSDDGSVAFVRHLGATTSRPQRSEVRVWRRATGRVERLVAGGSAEVELSGDGRSVLVTTAAALLSGRPQQHEDIYRWRP